jgi:hypothetical protein
MCKKGGGKFNRTIRIILPFLCITKMVTVTLMVNAHDFGFEFIFTRACLG